uniref:Uncharacterized protein n=1 Tax=Avena sativa TaxID=4498 RepID=A0ACD6A859_AVESA
MQELVCQRSGVNRSTKQSTTRCDCKARIKICHNDQLKWYVRSFSETHNHDLVESCGEKKHIFSHQHIDKHTKDIVRYLRENNISLSRVDSIMGSLFGSAEKVPFSKKSLRTVCSRIAKESLQDDVVKTMDMFRDMIAKDEKFVFSAQVDDDNRLKSLMWTSGRSRFLYEHFGNAITFDTTYETNIYKMPFGMFVGVSNHFESVIFAGVLLTNETAADFKWAFKQFVSMMGGKAPATMLTDQAKAMLIAIKAVLPETNHRWCKWHVLRKAQEVLGHVYKKYPTFSDDFHKLANHMLTIDEFESAWKAISIKYGLEANPFMVRAFECRDKWAKPYFKGIFCARMTSTQRSESANHVLKIYIPCNSSINRFIAKYSKLISDRENSDQECEKNTKQKSIELQCGFPVEKHASMIYTRKVYNLFKMELLKSTKYVIVPREGNNIVEVKHVQAELRDSWCKVNYIIEVDNSVGYYKCECGLYEHFGIVCSHIISVFINRGVCQIPECHIMKRWTRQARMSTFDPNLRTLGKDRRIESRSFRHKVMYMSAMELVNIAEVDEKACEIATRNLDRAKKEISEYRHRS